MIFRIVGGLLHKDLTHHLVLNSKELVTIELNIFNR